MLPNVKQGVLHQAGLSPKLNMNRACQKFENDILYGLGSNFLTSCPSRKHLIWKFKNQEMYMFGTVSEIKQLLSITNLFGTSIKMPSLKLLFCPFNVEWRKRVVVHLLQDSFYTRWYDTIIYKRKYSLDKTLWKVFYDTSEIPRDPPRDISPISLCVNWHDPKIHALHTQSRETKFS